MDGGRWERGGGGVIALRRNNAPICIAAGFVFENILNALRSTLTRVDAFLFIFLFWLGFLR